MKTKMIMLMVSTAISACLISTTAMAVSDDVFCRKIAELAQGVMEARQEGVPIIKMLEVSDSAEGRPQSISKYLVKQAFRSPKYSGDEMKQETATEFAAQQYLICVQAREASK